MKSSKEALQAAAAVTCLTAGVLLGVVAADRIVDTQPDATQEVVWAEAAPYNTGEAFNQGALELGTVMLAAGGDVFASLGLAAQLYYDRRQRSATPLPATAN
jgi:hypothetical protein